MYRNTNNPDLQGTVTGEIPFRGRNWSEMKDDIARLIVTKLWFYPHHRKIATVCSDWYRIAKEVHGPFQPNSLFLLLPYNNKKDKCAIYQISNSETCEFACPVLRDKFVHGSSNGWVAVDDKNLKLSLINPLTRREIALPPTYTINTIIRNDEDWNEMFEPGIRYTLLTKFALSETENGCLSYDCIIAAAISELQSLHFCRLGDNSWTPIKVTNSEPNAGDLCNFISDVLFFDEKLYASNGGYHVIIVNFHGSKYMARSIRGPNYQKGDKFGNPTRIFRSEENLFVQRTYLVECSGRVIAVRKIGEIISDYTTKTSFFQVFELEEENETWKMITGLGEKSLFLGQNKSISVSAEVLRGCKPNCIYFTDDFYYNQHTKESGFGADNGVYSLEDGTIEMFNISHSVVHWEVPSVWVCPSM